MKRALLACGLALLALGGCEGRISNPDPPAPRIDAELRANFGNWGVIPIGPMPVQDPAKVALGRALFFDKILSGNRDIACATCHQPGAALGDGLALAVGTGFTGVGTSRTPGPGRGFVPRHSPSLLNAGLGLFYAFWDGRLSSGFGPGPFQVLPDSFFLSGASNILAAQAMLPVLNRVEMRGQPGDHDVFGDPNELAAFADGQRAEIWQGVMQRLTAIPEYVDLFRAAFPTTPTTGLRFQHAAEAIAAFQRHAFTYTGAPLDRYLARDDAALTLEQKLGAQLFTGRAQCVSCHNGPFLGGQSFANVGAPQVGPGGTAEPPLDLGRGEFEREFYRFAFRVPPLRNVELTAPYMHSGAYPTLEAVVDHYDDVRLALATYDVSQLPPALRGQYHGDETSVSEVLARLDFRISTPLDFTDAEKHNLLAFLRSLTDPNARDLSSLAPTQVPSGLPMQ